VAALVILARVALGGMFGVAAVTKLSDGRGRRAVAAFGVPGRVAAPIGWALICGELGALALLAVGSSWVAGLVACALLTGFSAAVVVNLAQGRSPDCHCFGRLSSSPIGWSTVARNGFFAALAVLVMLEGRFDGWCSGIAVIALGLWVVPVLLRRRSRRVPSAAVPFALSDHTGRTVTFDALGADNRPLVLVFGQPGCGACDALLPDVARWQGELAEQVTVALVIGGPPANGADQVREYGLGTVLFDDRRSVFAAYGVTATPCAVRIEGHRTSAMALGAQEIERLVEGTPAAGGEPRVTRRQAITTGSALSVFAMIAAACGATTKTSAGGSTTVPTKDGLRVDGTWLCNQPFALCTTASCQPSTTDPNISVCQCVMQNGYSVGYKSCAERAQKGSSVRSDFSTININPSFAVLTCPSEVPWANCVDVECEIDPTNPALAICQCVTVRTGQSFTFGGGCDPTNCTSEIWSGASAQSSLNTAYLKGMKQLGQPVTFPKACPSPNTTTTT
jgi:thiol-disulfide isomerase/thioredoxin